MGQFEKMLADEQNFVAARRYGGMVSQAHAQEPNDSGNKGAMGNMKEKTTGFLAEFRKFIARGNVIDMAVGVIIGAAFKAIVDSLTADILMPLIGIFVDEASLSALSVQVGSAMITYGNFLQAIVNFLIMALVLFCIVKVMNSLNRKKEETPAAPPAPSSEELLLAEIRDLLKKQKAEQ